MQLLTINSNHKSDLFGALASGLCVLHCLATPLLFVVQASISSCSETGPIWWRTLDYVFLVISFIAIYHTTKLTSIEWMSKTLYISWGVLAFLIINEEIHLLPIPHILIYIPAFSLVFLHLYNRKHTVCETEECCVTE